MDVHLDRGRLGGSNSESTLFFLICTEMLPFLLKMLDSISADACLSLSKEETTSLSSSSILTIFYCLLYDVICTSYCFQMLSDLVGQFLYILCLHICVKNIIEDRRVQYSVLCPALAALAASESNNKDHFHVCTVQPCQCGLLIHFTVR